MLGILVTLVPAAVSAEPSASAFTFDSVLQKAQALAAKPYQAPAAIPDYLTSVDYDQYQKIRFHPEQSLWRDDQSRFQVMLIAPGEYFRYPVQVDTVSAAGVHPVAFNKGWFTWPSQQLESKVPKDLGYAGFKLTFPLNQRGAHNQFLVFAGASYFRGVARDQTFGLSARGIAINTGLPGGEEFPNFTHFWLVHPGADAPSMDLYALLDGPSLTGAYRFAIVPGEPTRIEVHARLFVRKDISLLGTAPLTSMFYYGANTPRPSGEWRPAVHDSGGLLLHSASGEWLWRPLTNPLTLQLSYFEASSPEGFGLLQRTTRFDAYEDAGARYDKRPSAWVVPHGDWGKGSVVLVEIPSNSETDDNIVAFWSPTAKTKAGAHYDIDYTLNLGDADIANEPMAHAIATFVGSVKPLPGSKSQHAYRLVVDFAGGPLRHVGAGNPVTAVVTGVEGTQVLSYNVEWVAPNNHWRLSLVATPATGKPLDLRAFLKSGKQTLSETWTYALPAKNRIQGG
ncbi:MAG: glucan biosynthesis protein G [Rhodanobacter sp.]